MLIVPKASVRVSLAIAILLTIILSWALSAGIANYFNYLSIHALYQEMLKRPDIYPRPMPEPKFGIVEFLTGRPPFHRRPEQPQPPPIPGIGMRPGRPPRPAPMRPEPRWLLLRLAVAAGLAVAAAVWLGRRFSTPLTQLAEGAQAFHSGNFAYRIPAAGQDEFSAVATAMNDMARQVSDQISNLEQDAERRRRFLADIAHELRSPVATMRTMAGALQDGVAEEPKRRNRAISALVNTSERLQRLIQDLMDLAKLDLNELPMNFKKVDVRELIESSLHSHESEAAKAGIILHPLEAASPVIAMADPDRITQALNNILENAISYAGKSADVRISLEDGDPVKIVVADTGKGIRTADMPYIFDSFYRADAARTPGDCHSGLGLSITGRLIEAHSGKLTVSSEEGKGTTVTILIPKGQ